MLATVILSARVPRRKPCSFKEFLPKVSLSAVFRFCLLFARAARSEQRAYLASLSGVCLGSDAFFPFGDNIERAARSGVTYIAQPGGSIRDDLVIEACDKHKMVMAMTGMRLFHH